jgi:hypothetical protein
MSTDSYPEVSVDDESGIGPSQTARPAEWPKKIRTLTAAELDRLTIDHNGRFYWDGKLVNYEPPQSRPQDEKASESHDTTSIDTLDRPDYDIGDHRTPEPIEGAEIPGSAEARARREDMRAVDLDALATPAAAAASAVETRALEPRAAEGARIASAIQTTDRLRLSLSRWQSLGAIIVVLWVMIGATGMAAYGLVVAHDWGCRIGLITNYCPASPMTKPPVRPDIPA